METKQNEMSLLKKIWKNKKGKAALKMGLWFFFFCLVGIYMLFTEVASEPATQKETKTPKEFAEFSVMWKNLESQPLEYEYEITEKETSDNVYYRGKIEHDIEVGTRDSKIGQITYRRENEKAYQIEGEETTEIDDLYEEEDDKYLLLKNIKQYFNSLTMKEEKNGSERVISYQNERETIKIITNTEEITKILVETAAKKYVLNYHILANLNE